MDGDFNILLKFENASFSKQTQMPYSYVDDTTVKIKYVLHKGDSVEKTIFFNASQIQGFSITISLEKTNFIEFIKANALFPTQVSYLWDPVLQSFNCTTAE